MESIHKYINALIIVSASCAELDRSTLCELKESCSINRDPEEFVSRFLEVIHGIYIEQDVIDASDLCSEEEYMGRIFEIMFRQGDTVSDYEDTIECTFDNQFVKDRLMAIIYEIHGPIYDDDSDYEEYCPDCIDCDLCTDCFSANDQLLVPDNDEQKAYLTRIRVKLCSECLIPDEKDICGDCILENIRYLY
jgi:hypothetical protein